MTPAEAYIGVAIGVATAAATLTGGAIALRFRSSLTPLFSFSSGAVIGVALLDLLPEALKLASSSTTPLFITTAMTGGFAAYYFIDRIMALMTQGAVKRPNYFGPGSLTAHSLVDGLGIGLAFQVSAATGLVVAVAVLAHDMVDGANTVALSLANGGKTSIARRWLAADAIAPLIGIDLGRILVVFPNVLAMLLSVFAGCFLYIGAGELLPLSRQSDGSLTRIGSFGVGIGLIYIVVQFAAT